MQAPPRRALRALGCALVVGLVALACGDGGGVGPGALRFGWVGQVTIEVETPRRLVIGSLGPEPAGFLKQTLTWQASGAWSLHEAISYRGLVGDESLITEKAVFGDAYARFITHIHETPGLALFVAELPDTVTAVCGNTLTKISVTIQDDLRKQSQRWERCAQGHLSEIVPRGAGPDAGAARLVQAIQQARDETVGSSFRSEYAATVPFGTLARGEDGGSALTGPFVVTSDAEWRAFWLGHAASDTPPTVDFATEMVTVAAVGPRFEAGDSVEVRQIFEIGAGTLTHLVERRPGDFCSPVARTHIPFHIVVSPITPLPVDFAEVVVEHVPCGS